MPFTFTPTEIPEVVLITPRLFGGSRGAFWEAYKKSEFAKAGITVDFVQDNQSISARGVLRGLHYQKPPHAQAKLVRVVSGIIYDVAVDIRKGSPGFGRWVGRELSAEYRAMLYIPAGFAHGFAVLSDTAEVHYKTSNEYAPQAEAGVMWNDPAINIDWPLSQPRLSDKDTTWPSLIEADNGFVYAGSGS